jgi:hypothetical protein
VTSALRVMQGRSVSRWMSKLLAARSPHRLPSPTLVLLCQQFSSLRCCRLRHLTVYHARRTALGRSVDPFFHGANAGRFRVYHSKRSSGRHHDVAWFAGHPYARRAACPARGAARIRSAEGRGGSLPGAVPGCRTPARHPGRGDQSRRVIPAARSADRSPRGFSRRWIARSIRSRWR